MSRITQRVCRALGCGVVGGVFLNSFSPSSFSGEHSLMSHLLSRMGFEEISSKSFVACCRQRLDTPEYLIPYYLRSNLSRFSYYASKKEGGSKFKRMSEEEFLAALIGQDKNKPVRNSRAATDLFEQFDTNGDGEISFKEFSFMLTLLATPHDSFVTAFQMFNRAQPTSSSFAFNATTNPLKATLSFEEFSEFMETVGDEHSKPRIKNLLMNKLFGENGTRRCTAEEMLNEVDLFKTKVWRAEFLQHVPEEEVASAKSDAELSVTTEAVGSLLYDHLVGRHLPFSVVKNLRRMRQYDRSSDAEKITLENWYAISRLMENVERVGAAVRLYSQTMRKELNRSQFSRAITCAADPNLTRLSDRELDLLFALFDADGNGTIGFDELEALAQARRTFHCKSNIELKGDQREFFFPRLVKCTTEALLSE